ncbi:CehA/McbA family metallohydrolase [Hydrocarboniphaga sp.]|uniref:CehA/McbA family metallohydrolase n=1 Tax=Hydrocarboniphaga sp. TaxID=2033016 RepID=UPI003D128454
MNNRIRLATAGALLPVTLLATAYAADAPPACEAYTGPALDTLQAYEGITHEHSSYSDGDPHTRPDDYYRLAAERGYDFAAGSEHSDSLDAGNFISLHASCDPTSGKFDPTQLEYCFLNPSADKLFKWTATQQQAQARSSPTFLAIRGFEWTSDVFGHINVYFSQNFSNAKTDLGYALTLKTFWDWFARPPYQIGLAGSASSPVPFGGGGDGLAVFNHPHDKCLTKNDPTGLLAKQCDWNDYELIPAAAERMVGIEAYNDGNRDDRYLPYIARALDKGWRLGFFGSEDEHFGLYADESKPKTVTLAAALSEAGFREAWLARRNYALSPGQHLRAKFSAEGHPMGSELQCQTGRRVAMQVNVRDRNGRPFSGSLRLYTDGGEELSRLASANGRFNVEVKAGRHWYFVRVDDASGRSAAYLAPVWIDGSVQPRNGSWLSGDMHVHTDHSADGSLLRQLFDDRAPGNVSVADQIGEAQRNGLQWLPLTDHRTYDQHYDPQWESSKLLLIPGEEANGSPHVTIHGAVDMIDQADAPAGSPEFRSIQQSLWSAHAQGAVFAVAHPDDGELDSSGLPNNRANLVGMDSMEVWNRGSDIEAEIDYAENRWNRGFRFGINGASDDHFRELWGLTSPGTPRTQIFAERYSERGVLQGIAAAHDMLRLRATDPQITLEADFQNDGVFEALQGDEIFTAPGTTARLRLHVSNALTALGSRLELYQAPGRSVGPLQSWIIDAPDKTVTIDITTPFDATWYRAEIRGLGEPAAIDTNLLKSLDLQAILKSRLLKLQDQRRAITSPIFVSAAPVEAQGEQAVPADNGGNDGAAVVIGNRGQWAGFPAVAESKSGVHVVAEQHGAGTTQVTYVHRLPSGASTIPVLLSGDSPAARFPKVAAVGSNVWVVWEDERAGQIPRRKAIYLRHSRDGGASWEPETALRVVPGRAEHPVIAATPAGEVIVAWAEIRAGSAFDIYAQVLGADAEPVNVSGTGKDVSAARLLDSRSARYPASVWPSLAAAPNGEVALAWQDNRGDRDPLFTGATAYGEGSAPDDWQILLSVRSRRGWSMANSLGAADRADRHPTVAYDADGTLAVAWDSKPLVAAGPSLSVYVAQSADGGATFTAPVLIGVNAAAFSQRPALARRTDGRLKLAWFDNSSADWRWRIAYSVLKKRQWSAPNLLRGRGNNTWPALDGDSLVFASSRNAQRLQRDATQQIVLRRD